MITLEEVRFELRDETIPELIVTRTIERMKGFLIDYTKKPHLFDENDNLDEVLLYLVCSRLSEDGRGKQGLASESIGGASYSFLNDLPEHMKTQLKKYRNTVSFL